MQDVQPMGTSFDPQGLLTHRGALQTPAMPSAWPTPRRGRRFLALVGERCKANPTMHTPKESPLPLPRKERRQTSDRRQRRRRKKTHERCPHRSWIHSPHGRLHCRK
eukprot:scaffold120343_cov25-Tisochrysis_lutea.AAC.1